jgi:hypothetical protein
MTDDNDDFDYSDLVPQVVLRSTPPPLAKRTGKHVQVPLWMSDALTRAGAPGSAWAVLHFLLFESWKTESVKIEFANGFAKTLGISHDSKIRGLRELERLGLVSVEWRDRKSPVVRIVGSGRHQK